MFSEKETDKNMDLKNLPSTPQDPEQPMEILCWIT
jgi:hypothetical protein